MTRKETIDTALTWEDVKRIVEIAEAGIIEPFLSSEQVYYEEVLRRFNEGYLKGRKEAHIPARKLGLPSSLDDDSPKIKGWVARDKDGQISCYCDKPYRTNYCWYSSPRYEVWILPDELYPELKWEDEPIEVELPIIKTEKSK